MIRFVFQDASLCSPYGPEMSRGQASLFARSPAAALSPPILLDWKDSGVSATTTPHRRLSFPSLQGRRTGPEHIWESLKMHGREPFGAVVCSPGALNRTINIDLLTTPTGRFTRPPCAAACRSRGMTCISPYQTHAVIQT